MVPILPKQHRPSLKTKKRQPVRAAVSLRYEEFYFFLAQHDFAVFLHAFFAAGFLAAFFVAIFFSLVDDDKNVSKSTSVTLFPEIFLGITH
jgi:hypothetical protein